MDDSQIRQLLCLVWGHRLFAADDIGGEEVLAPGHAPEKEAGASPGPDFCGASVAFGEVEVHGAVRVDSRSSLWRESGCMGDAVFDSVAFHVVGERDRVLVREGREVRTLVLRIDERLVGLYQSLIRGAGAAEQGEECVLFCRGLEPVEQGQILARLLAERLRRKADEVARIHAWSGGDWDQTAYVCFLRSLGMGDRKLSYEALARSVPFRCFVRCAGDVRQAEALLLGQSGYLTGVLDADPQIRQLQDIYLALKEEYGLRRPVVAWAGAGVRPSSLPPSMLRRAAELLAHTPGLAGRVREAAQGGMKALREVFGGPENGASMEKVDLRIINFVIPLLTAMGRAAGDVALQERALGLYDEVGPETNRYTRWWSRGLELWSASDSQAVVQLCTEYCGRGRCGECPVGILRLVRLWRAIRPPVPPGTRAGGLR